MLCFAVLQQRQYVSGVFPDKKNNYTKCLGIFPEDDIVNTPCGTKIHIISIRKITQFKMISMLCTA